MTRAYVWNCDMTHLCVMHTAATCVAGLIPMCVVNHGTAITESRGTWLVHMCDIVTWLIYVWCIPQPRVWQDSIVCVWYDTFLCVLLIVALNHGVTGHTTRAHVWHCDMTHSCVWHTAATCVAGLIAMCVVTHGTWITESRGTWLTFSLCLPPPLALSPFHPSLPPSLALSHAHHTDSLKLEWIPDWVAIIGSGIFSFQSKQVSFA